jgi:serine kinase of HPr protein (carbohydrate metabolism regulator)
LALRFLYLARRGPAALKRPLLVADDQVRLSAHGGRLWAAAPEAIRGKLEVRGVGLVEVAALVQAEVKLVVDLVAEREVERLPLTETQARYCGLATPLLRLAPREPSAPIKLALALARAQA